MKSSQAFLVAACAASVLLAAEAGAVMVAGGGGLVAPPGIGRPVPAALPPTMNLIGGTISSVDTATRTMDVSGATLTWHPTQLRIFHANGVPGSEQDLRPGTRVRFALEPGESGTRRVVLIYVDARS